MLNSMASEVTCANCHKKFRAIRKPPRLPPPKYFCCKECASAYETKHANDDPTEDE